MPRKRFNAFEDFPESTPEDVQAQPKLTPGPRAAEPNAVERIERLRPSQMLPDRFQPRRLLPTPLRRAFFSGEMDCYQAAEGWLALAHSRSQPSALTSMAICGADCTASTTLTAPTARAAAQLAVLEQVRGDLAALSATASGLGTVTSNSFAITGGPLSRLAFKVQPTAAAPGAPITPAMQVALLDAAGNPASSTAAVTLSLSTNPGGATGAAARLAPFS